MNAPVGLPPVKLGDGRLVLRPLRPEDAPEVLAALSGRDDELARWMMWVDGLNDLAGAERFLRDRAEAWTRGEAYNFALEEVASGEFLGACGLSQFNWSCRVANVLYWIRGSRRGEGFAPAAVRLLAPFGFGTLGLHRLEILAEVPNLASQRVAEKSGATREGVLRSRLNNRGIARDAVIFSLLPGDLT